MIDLLKKFEKTSPELVFEWNDKETTAKGWVVINSLRGGAAGGGTRMRKGLNKNEVVSLAKTMEIKFTVSGPEIGGAKSGIDFDPKDPRKDEVLKRWYKVVIPLLKNYYGTGGDMNVDEIEDVIPITEGYGLWHPQEGIVTGHYKATAPEKIQKLGQLRIGVKQIIEAPKFSPDINRKYTVSDMITGYGVAESVRHYYNIWGGELKGKRVIIQGWGNVGAAAGFYLSKAGAKIVGIIDGGGAVINTNGFSYEEIKDLFNNRDNRMLASDQLIPFNEGNEKIWDLEAEILIPAAGSRLVSKSNLEKLINKGLEVVSNGANVPFMDEEIFYGETLEYADDNVVVIPDFIANCGMARTFAYLMESKVEVSSEAIFKDTSQKIKNALVEIHKLNTDKTNITSTALEIAVKQLV